MNIMLDDLKLDKQKELLDFLGLNTAQEGSYDILPMFVISDIKTTDKGKPHYDRLVVSFLKTR